ncbi:Cation/multidrug efflux pump [Melioribacter roseus P3M-2]|uniref:Cation/multidrug efflux pump n=1 Tax=Melioribacter roseus (strain DSM 23840 / JCM 17771 / VKM B-2668 / P3M-2) TaxID=1191523 RepID=I6Z5P9_MELRP|nr:efflux RND transporter permease subunit [Melioribacter roseus]AFN74490.1 Cation/multidrug efflux pump [Melioribacter roseus P3M-2]
MNLPEISVRRPITTIMLFIAIVIIGLVSFQRLPIDLFPEIDPPYISVLTQYPGASAQDVEINVSKKIESGLSSVTNLKKISSVSIDNISVVQLEFEYGTNLDEASNDIRSALEFAKRNLPDDAEDPIIFKFSTNIFPILFIAVQAEESYVGLNKLVEREIIDPLKRVNGVGTVQAFGGPVRQILINVDAKKLEAYNISPAQISQILQAENVNLPSGSIKVGDMEYNLRVPGEFTDVNDIKNIVVSQSGGRLVYLKDVAVVKDSLKDRTIDVRLNGGRGLFIIVQKQSGANTVQVAEDVKAKIEELKKNLPSDVKIDITQDSSEFIIQSVNNLTEAVLLGAVFVSFVVLLFLRKWRATFIIVLTLPVSLIGAFIYLYFSGNTINIISLSSLSIAVGLVVDDAIVILENIARHVERGARPREAAVFGSSEVGLAVAAATFTIVAVFFPLVFISGIAGILFNQLGFLVTVMILVSLLAALTLIPMLSSKLLKSRKEEKPIKNPLLKKIDEGLSSALESVDNFYTRVLKWALDHRKTVVLTALLIFASSIMLLGTLGTEFIPKSDSSQFQLTLEIEPGKRLEETINYVKEIERIVKEDFPEVQYMTARSGVNDQGFSSVLFGQSEGTNIATFQFKTSKIDERNRSVFEMADALRERLNSFVGIKSISVNTAGAGAFLTGATGAPVEVDIIGPDLDESYKIANSIKEYMNSIEGTRDVRIDIGDPRPELQIVLQRDKMAMSGLNTAMVGNALRSHYYGITSTTYRELGDEYDIFISLPPEKKTSIDDIENLPVKTLLGTTVRLKDVGKVVQAYSPPTIKRREQERVIAVLSDVEGRSLGEVTSDIQNFVAGIELPPNTTIEYGGQIEQQSDTFKDLMLLLALSVILVYMVMAAQFESLLDPFIIMFSVPFAFTGVFIALFITGIPFSVIAFLGSIMLVGIVVKNAIVLVDFTNITRARGYELREAIIYSGRNRLRPVLMTTFTTLLGLLPLAISTGEGSEIWQPLGISTIGGLFFSTLITLILVPVLYSYFETKVKQKKIVD